MKFLLFCCQDVEKFLIETFNSRPEAENWRNKFQEFGCKVSSYGIETQEDKKALIKGEKVTCFKNCKLESFNTNINENKIVDIERGEQFIIVDRTKTFMDSVFVFSPIRECYFWFPIKNIE